jgi:hypothetical protein
MSDGVWGRPVAGLKPARTARAGVSNLPTPWDSDSNSNSNSDSGDDAAPVDSTDGGDGPAALDPDALDAALADAFEATDGERRVVVRQATDLADAGLVERDRGEPLTVETVVAELRAAPDDESLPSQWNWWIGSMELAYGDYAEFQVRRYRA